MAFFRSQLWIY